MHASRETWRTRDTQGLATLAFETQDLHTKALCMVMDNFSRYLLLGTRSYFKWQKFEDPACNR